MKQSGGKNEDSTKRRTSEITFQDNGYNMNGIKKGSFSFFSLSFILLAFDLK